MSVDDYCRPSKRITLKPSSIDTFKRFLGCCFLGAPLWKIIENNNSKHKKPTFQSAKEILERSQHKNAKTQQMSAIDFLLPLSSFSSRERVREGEREKEWEWARARVIMALHYTKTLYCTGRICVQANLNETTNLSCAIAPKKKQQ